MQKVHFRLTSVAQKRCCLSSLFFFSGCRPRFARLAASPLPRACIALTKSEEKRETARGQKEITNLEIFSLKRTNFSIMCRLNFQGIFIIILLHEKLLQSDWLRAVVFQLNLKYLHVKINKYHS